MRTWTRADRVTLCGRCEHRFLSVGEPMLVIRLQGREFIRGARGEGPAPPDLPPLVERTGITPTPLVRLAVGMLPLAWKRQPAPDRPGALDFKARATGEREVGEEG